MGSYPSRTLVPMDLSLSDPLRIDLDGSPFWRFEDGTLLPVISGGSDQGGGDGGQASGGASGAGGTGDGAGGSSSGDGQGGASGSGQGSGASTDDDKGKGDTKVEMTQAELDALIDKRLGRAKSQWEKEVQSAADKAKMDEADRAKAEKAEAEQKATEATERANRRLVVADAKVLAGSKDYGVPADRIAAFVKLADLSDIEVDDDGNVDAKALAKAVKKTIDDNPFLKEATGTGNGRSGGDMNGNGGTKKAGSLEEAVTAHYG